MKMLKRSAFCCFLLSQLAAHVRATDFLQFNQCYDSGFGYFWCRTDLVEPVLDQVTPEEVDEVCSNPDAYCSGPGLNLGARSCGQYDDFIVVSCLFYDPPPGCEATGCDAGYQCYAGSCQPLG